MKIAVSVLGKDENSLMDPKFGRASGFIVFDNDTNSYSYFPNDENIKLAQGAGIKTAQFIADLGVSTVISGHFGPKAASVLEKAEIKMINGEEGKTVKQLIASLV
jgi:predicted Fe-Mo cluster-binding NifX family protein